MALDFNYYAEKYLPTLVAQKNIAYQAHQTATHWAFILTGAVLAVSFNNPRFPNFWSFALAGVLSGVVTHIGTRVGKSYVNQIRWNTLERELLILAADTAKSDEDKVVEYRALVHAYHCQWESPVPMWRVIIKVLFELGFFPIITGTFALFIYEYIKVRDASCSVKTALLIIVLIYTATEVLVLRFGSQYFRKVHVVEEVKL